MKPYDWYIQSANSADVDTPEIIGEKLLHTLDSLALADPLLRDWTIGSGNATLEELEIWMEEGGEEPAPIRMVPLAEARDDMTALVQANVQRDDWGEAQPAQGYALTVVSGAENKSRSVNLSLNVGSQFNDNNWSVRFGAFGEPFDPALVDLRLMDGLFRTMTSFWPTPWARLRGSAIEYEDAPGVIGRTTVETVRHDIAWMGYLSTELAAGFAPPPELITERTAGGLLMLSSRERPDPSNADQMRKSDLLDSIMEEHYPAS